VADEQKDMAGRTAVVTGASSGIGAAAARALAARGFTVLAVGRNPERTAAIGADVGVDPVVADFADLNQVRRLAAAITARLDRIDVLALNAGVMEPTFSVTENGFERTFQTNYLAPFLLQLMLHPWLVKSGSRVIVTSSSGHWLGRIDLETFGQLPAPYSGFRAYANSKLALTLFTRELARRYSGVGLTAVSFHPGFVRTGFTDAAQASFGRTQARVFGKILPILEPDQGAEPLVHLATTPERSRLRGKYFSRMNPNARTSPPARNANLGYSLWNATEKLVS
jgi:NAD(P)-dependent dehydrogenase (short-subunit alcohol dehydrogenase family)